MKVAIALLVILPAVLSQSGCTDNNASCDSWKNAGYCRTSSYVRKNCKKSCKDASCAVKVCKDSSSQCPSHASSGYCNDAITKDCMKRSCPLSCRICTPPTAAPTAAPTVAPTAPPAGSCGKSTVPQSRIIEGVDSKPGAWPWMASLFMYGRSHICGGSLINPKWVLTASHCVVGTGASPSTMKIKLGEHDHRRKDGNEQLIDIEKIIPHPRYSRNSLTNDIALIKLKTPARLNSRVQTICMPSKDSRPAVGSKQCYLSGWGSIQHPGGAHHTLQQAMLPVADVSKCFNRADMVCTGFGYTKKTNACRGDSGGPYVCRRSDGSWEQHGVASFVVTYCKYYTAFTQVSSYIDWMNQHINDMS